MNLSFTDPELTVLEVSLFMEDSILSPILNEGDAMSLSSLTLMAPPKKKCMTSVSEPLFGFQLGTEIS